MRELRRRPLILALIAGAVFGTAVWATCQSRVAREFDTALFDICFDWRGQRDSKTRLLIIGIDDAAMRQIHKPLPFISPELADVVQTLKSRGAAAIGLDLIIPDELRDFPGLQTEALAKAIEGHQVVLSKWLDRDPPLVPILQWQAPLNADWQLAFTDLTVDRDYVVRRQQLQAVREDRVHTHFALGLCRAARSNAIQIGQADVLFNNRRVPLDAEGRLAINYVGPPGTIGNISFLEALRAAHGESSTVPADLKDTIVIIGVTSPSQQDYHRTPFSHQVATGFSRAEEHLMSGAEINANLVATILDEAFFVPVRWPSSLPVMALVGSLLGAILTKCRWWQAIVVVTAFHFAWKAIAVAALTHRNAQIHLLPMLMLGPLMFMVVVWVRWQAVRGIMSAVKSSQVAAALEALDRGPQLRGELRLITVFFADVRGFTTFSEAAREDPQRIVALLNEFFGEAAPIIERRHGIIDKYIGDGIMAIFGAPQAHPSHASEAVHAAVELVQAVRKKQARWLALGNPGMRIGIGIHTGVAVVGTIGSHDRLDYTAIGDTVNAAARLEGANKELGTEVLISKQTYDAILAIGGEPVLQRLGCAREAETVGAKGRSDLVVYRVNVN